MDRDMNRAALILYGPPAAGKDTITAELVQLDRRYTPFRRIKIGNGNTDGYRLSGRAELHKLRADSQVLYENERYGNRYVVDEPHLAAILDGGGIPIIHIGQLDGITALRRYPARWTSVLLWCAKETTAARSRMRGSRDVDARLTAWDETASDLSHGTDDDFGLRIDTDSTGPDLAARTIHSHMLAANPSRARRRSCPPR
jgi:guanylate kinase